MSVTRSTIVKCVFGGWIGASPPGFEIWSTSFNLAAYSGTGAAGTNVNMEAFDAAGYLTDHLEPFIRLVMAASMAGFTATFAKVNRFTINAGKTSVKYPNGRIGVHQIDDPTVEDLTLNIPAQASSSNPYPSFVAQGLGLTTSGGSRGRATRGRMFLPTPLNPYDVGSGRFTSVTAAQTAMAHGGWDALQASDTANEVSYNPSLVSPPKVMQAGSLFLCNLADITTLENVPFIMGTRKNAEKPGSLGTYQHPTFA